MKSAERGFTLIELIVVIVILGILAATALPKFINLSSDARAAAIKGVSGAISGSAALIYGRAAASGLAGAAATLLPSVIGATGVSIAYGFPQTASAFSAIMDLSSDFSFSANRVQTNNYSLCSFEYIPATGATTPARISIQTNANLVTNCS